MRKIINVTEAARNLAVCTGRDLISALAAAKLPPAEAKAWNRDLRAGRKRLKPVSNKWR